MNWVTVRAEVALLWLTISTNTLAVLNDVFKRHHNRLFKSHHVGWRLGPGVAGDKTLRSSPEGEGDGLGGREVGPPSAEGISSVLNVLLVFLLFPPQTHPR